MADNTNSGGVGSISKPNKKDYVPEKFVPFFGVSNAVLTASKANRGADYNRGTRDERYDYAISHGLSDSYASRYADDTTSLDNWESPWYDIFGTQRKKYLKGLAEADSALLTSLRNEMESDPEHVRKKQEDAGYNVALAASTGDSSVMSQGAENLGTAQGMPDGGIAPDATSGGFAESDLGKVGQALQDAIGVVITAYTGVTQGSLNLAQAGTTTAQAGLLGEQTISEQFRQRMLSSQGELFDAEAFNKMLEGVNLGDVHERHYLDMTLSLIQGLDTLVSEGVDNVDVLRIIKSAKNILPDTYYRYLDTYGRSLSRSEGGKAHRVEHQASAERSLNDIENSIATRPYIKPLADISYSIFQMQCQARMAEFEFQRAYFSARSGKTEGEQETLLAEYNANIASTRSRYEEACFKLYQDGVERIRRLAYNENVKPADFTDLTEYRNYKKNPEKYMGVYRQQFLTLINNASTLYQAQSNEESIKSQRFQRGVQGIGVGLDAINTALGAFGSLGKSGTSANVNPYEYWNPSF